MEGALRIYKSGSDELYRKGEIARMHFQLVKLYTNLKKMDKVEDARKMAVQIQSEPRPWEHQKEPAFGEHDRLVSIWAR